jgi:hypothetical protein
VQQLHCTYATDAFSLGVVCLELLTAMPAVDLARTRLSPPLNPLLASICQLTPAALDGCLSACWQGDGECVQRGQRFKDIAAKLTHPRPEERLSVGAARQWLAKLEGEQQPPSGASHAGASSAAGAGAGGSSEMPPDVPPDRCCAICLEDYAALLERDGGQQALLLPCRHACLCVSCAAMIVRMHHPCPICRQPVRAFDAGVFDKTYVAYPALGRAGAAAAAAAAGGGRAGGRGHGQGRGSGRHASS